MCNYYFRFIFVLLLGSSHYYLQGQSYIQGKVVNKRGFEMQGIKVINKNNRAKTTSDKNGSFILKVANLEEFSKEDVTIISPFNTVSDFEVYIEGPRMEIIIDIPMFPVYKVSVFSVGGHPLKDIEVWTEGNTYKTNQQGSSPVNDPKVKNESKFNIDGEEVTIKTFNYQTKHMTLFIERENPDDTLSLNVIDELVIRRDILDTRREEVKKEISELEALLNKKDLSPAEKARVRQKIKELKQELNAIVNEQKSIELEAFDKLQRLEVIAGEQLKKLRQKEKDLLRAEEAKKQAEITQQKNLIIFLLIFVFLVLLALFFFIVGKKQKKQKEEIETKNKEIENKNIILNEQQEEMKTQADILKQANSEISAQNKKITDSIEYAQTIQNSILPTESEIENIFGQNYFLIYEPKDIVSGDFYWFEQKEKELILVLGDCTGHGVPGGFMTMLGNSLLNQIIHEENTSNPAKILTQLNKSLRQNLKQEQEHQEPKKLDGISMQVLTFYPEQGICLFAGAKSNLLYVKDGKCERIRGENLMLGYPQEKEFENITITLDGSETFYLTTDGFPDQLGGNYPKRKLKYMKKNFMDLLAKISDNDLEIQKKLLLEELEAWKGNTPQTDDLSIIAIKSKEILEK